MVMALCAIAYTGPMRPAVSAAYGLQGVQQPRPPAGGGAVEAFAYLSSRIARVEFSGICTLNFLVEFALNSSWVYPGIGHV